MNEDQLTALDLMMERADELHGDVIGAPKPRRRRKQPKSDDDFIDAFDFLDAESAKDFEYSHTVIVGSKTRRAEPRTRKQRETAQVEAQPDVSAATVQPQATATTPADVRTAELVVNRPSQQQVDQAFEQLFKQQDAGTSDVVDAIDRNAKISQETADALERWLEWEKTQAFIEQNRVREDEHKAVSSDQVNNTNTGGDSSGGGLEDLIPEGRGRRGRRGGRTGGRRFPKMRGKLGALLGLGLGIGGGALAYNFATSEKSQASDALAGTTVSPEVAGVPEGKYDAAMNAGMAGSLLLGGAKRVPFVGPAVALASGGYDAAKIAASDMSDSEKEKAYTKTAVATGSSAAGATAGALIGGFIGSIIPVAGTAAGAALGGILGGALGDYFGDSIGEYVANSIKDDTEEAKAEKEKMKVTASPSGGGSSLLNPNAFAPYRPQSQGGGSNIPLNYARPAQPGRSAAQVAGAIGDLPLGAVSAHYESGNRGVGTVSSGAGDYGGVSYGRHQLSSTAGTMTSFLNSPEGRKYAASFGGAAPGTAQFNETYKAIAAQDQEGFAAAQEAFITRTHYKAQMDKLQESGIDLSGKGRAVQEAVFSASTQYGASSDVIQKALAGKDTSTMSDTDIVNAIQDYRNASVDSRFRSSSQNVKDSVRQRTENERETLLQIARNEAQAKGEVKAKIDDASTPAEATAVPVQVAAQAPVEQAAPEIRPAPPVETEVIVQQAPAPVAPATPRGARAEVRPVAQQQQAAPVNQHTLDGIPVYIDDPMMNLMNVGYL